MKRILVTGAAGKVGSHFIAHILQSDQDVRIRALCHNRMLEPEERLEIVRGTISDRAAVHSAMAGITHVLHCATCKETPDHVMDVAVKGLFWLLEDLPCQRRLPTDYPDRWRRRAGAFCLSASPAGHRNQKHSAYPGCYALSKVLEEVMLEQYFIQYDLNGCCLRAPWIMEKDDFKYPLSFGEDVFGGPRWRDLVGAKRADEYVQSGAVPIMLDPNGKPVQRNFVHVDDLVAAIVRALDHPNARQQTFNICMDEPVDYRHVADYLTETAGLPSVEIPTPYQSTWLDNTKAKFLLGWRPVFDLERLIEEAWTYQRSESDPRRVWYPG